MNPSILVMPADEGGCGHYRLIWPAQALGDRVRLVRRFDPPEQQIQCIWLRDYDGTSTMVDIEPPDADIVVVQRPLHQAHLDMIRHLQRHRILVVVEVDDNFDRIDRNNIAWHHVDPVLSPQANRRILAEACRIADHVVVSTPALAAHYGRHGRVSVVPNMIPARYLEVERPTNERVMVGWSGSVLTHPGDLQVMGGGLAEVLRRRQNVADFAVIGTGNEVASITGVSTPPRVSGWLPLNDYPVALAQLDVGVVPLALTPFNEAKSWLKGLEMAALGVPFVASPTAEYQRLGKRLGGATVPLAARPRDWVRELGLLVDDADYRQTVSAVNREGAGRMTIEAHAERWLEAWSTPARKLVRV